MSQPAKVIQMAPSGADEPAATSPGINVTPARTEEPEIVAHNSSGPKTVSLPSRRSNRPGSVRISSVDEEQEEEDIDPDSLPKEGFTEEHMQRIWNERVRHLFAGKPSLLSSLTKRPPRLTEEHDIELVLDSEHELETVKENRSALLEDIRRNLNNFSVQLYTPVEEVITSKKAYTPKEKYEKMLAQNPSLDLLRERFGLELDM